ncbi:MULTISPECIES: hypothetical protein [Haloferax]|uniref:Uncharacterized protein n=1 Tax=Haloferax marinum TaxID=2666143 RepID=A0A6A8GA08_9EURY|nr:MULTISPECIES: hypothetical protein [Haloferax]KAB1198625.1 hypothetical protein Hfx1150_14315 [Haloferax sp. CBA1150]MRW97737.1 hypothetical protein [Haloferax marinum]
MPSTHSRRSLLTRVGATLVSGVGLAGCLREAPETESESTNTTHSETTEDQTTTPASQTEIPFAEVTDEDAEARALAAEEAYLDSRLQNASCLLSWGTTPSTASREATVVERSADGVVVDVTHPYWYSKEGEEADLVSEAFYLMNNTSVRRTSGDEVSPC